MRKFLLLIIGFYQSYISPHKGFKCAYGIYHQNGTCSSKIKNIVLNEPYINIPKLIHGQFKSCKTAYKLLSEENEKKEDDAVAKCFLLDCGCQVCACPFT